MLSDETKTVRIERYGIKIGEEAKFEGVRDAAEKLAEAILSAKYPMIPNKTFDHHWVGTGLMSAINCPTVIQYVEPIEDSNEY
jgi:hypothetical protein